MSLRIGSKWIDKSTLSNGNLNGVEILTSGKCNYGDGELVWFGEHLNHTSAYSEAAIRSNFLEIPQELENEPEEVIRLYLAL